MKRRQLSSQSGLPPGKSVYLFNASYALRYWRRTHCHQVVFVPAAEVELQARPGFDVPAVPAIQHGRPPGLSCPKAL